MNSTATARRPDPTTRAPLYYQGRPNVVFLDRYDTSINRRTRRRGR